MNGHRARRWHRENATEHATLAMRPPIGPCAPPRPALERRLSGALPAATTVERPAPGVRVHQPARGFRYAMDPILLAGFVAEAGPPGRFLDVGTGCGVAALLLGRLGWHGVGMDVQEGVLDLARQGALDSGLADRLAFVGGDVRSLAAAAPPGAPPYPWVLCNPPYWRAGTGPLPADPAVAAARFALHGDLDELIPAMCRLGERVALVLPLARAREACVALRAAGRPIARRLDLLPRLCLIEGSRSAAPEGPRLEAPLRESGRHSARVRALYDAANAILPDAPPAAGQPSHAAPDTGGAP